ncbi:MAG: hypothetical protein K2M53_03935 [Muribaculaceae bacterium]|nr:hypothetical protein [Muribaculaceae bacterium]
MSANPRFLLPLAFAVLAAGASSASADDKVQVHGSVQANVFIPDDPDEYPLDKPVVFNTYADVGLVSKYVDAGLRFEFNKWPLPQYQTMKGYAGWGVPNIYAKGKWKGLELTAGDFYDQFGSGFILRTYEDRALGIDNSIRGGRLKVNSINGLRLTFLGGVQRNYWDWNRHTQVYGGNAEVYMQDYVKGFADKGVNWMLGASYVLLNEQRNELVVPGTDMALNLPKMVNALDVRSQFSKGTFNVTGEFAWKGQDPEACNNYTYRPGTAYMLSGSYSKTGISAMLQVKRTENMGFHSDREYKGTETMLNQLPPFSYQHTYALATLYPYSTQDSKGEWAFQGAFAYTFKRKTALGGKYGTKVNLNLSYIRSLKYGQAPEGMNGYLWGTDGPSTSFFGWGQTNYFDFNLQIEKKLTSAFQMTFMYMNQLYNPRVQDTAAEYGEENVKSNIFILDGKYKINRKFNVRAELQYLTTRQDHGDWTYGLVEFTYVPWVTFSVSDKWNCGGNQGHFYQFGVTGNYKSNRLMISYGKTRAGFDCSGGVCRWVPETKGVKIDYNYYF